VGLVTQQYWKKVSIFECEDSQVYSNGGVVQIGDLTTVEIKTNTSSMGNLSKAGTTTNSWLNTLTFMKAWELVLEDGRWWSHEWVAKVDPDAVFFPHRLKVGLYKYYTAGDPNGPALWVGNCDRSFQGNPKHLKIFGALEVFSRNALGMYNANGKHQCKEELDWEGWGEDYYMQRCMQLMNVQAVDGVSFFGDARCYYAPCTDTTKVAFHDFKDVGSYFACMDTSRNAEAAKVFMK